jgi:DnaJ domain
VRRVLRILLLSSLGLAGVSLAQARERLVMPFDCGLEGGHVKLAPAVPKSYPIIGTRDEEAITTCRPPLASGCRTLMVHRFVISCGGVGVAWMRVVAAIGRTGASHAWVDDGRLTVTLPARNAQGPGGACFDGMPAEGRNRLERRVVFMQECLPWRRRLADVDHVVLPEGYAPVGEFGARLQLVSADAGYSIDEARLDAGLDDAALVPGRGATLLAKADPQAAVDPAGAIYGGSHGATMAADEWVTVVRAERDYGGVPPSAKTASLPSAWMLFLFALGLMTAAGAAHLRASRLWPARVLASAPRLARAFRRDAPEHAGRRAFSAHSLTNAGAAVAAFFVQTEAAVAQLKGAGPLRDVLQSELKHLRERLSNVEAGAREGVPPANTGPHYRALVRELERIRRIAESAAASLSGGRPSNTLPRTTSEAYDVLGVNADVSEDVLKKIVDALRMSWHPDHARDEEDRRAREERIRQINVAWDLIISKRVAA